MSISAAEVEVGMDVGKIWGQAEHLRAAAYIAFDQGDIPKARDNYAQALFLYDQAQTQKPNKLVQKRIFHALITLASCALHEQDYCVARDFYLRILSTYQRRGRLRQEESLHLGLVRAYIGLGEMADAALHLLKLRDLARFHRLNRRLKLLQPLIEIAVQVQDFDIASTLFAEAVWVSQSLDWTFDQCKLLWAWGQIEYMRSHADGCALCQLAVVVASQLVDDVRYGYRWDYLEMFRQQITHLDCPS